MPEEQIIKYYSQPRFINKNFPIFEDDCNEGCELKGNFENCIILNGDNIKICLHLDEKSVDRIVFAKKAVDNKLDVILCELSDGKKRYTDVVKKVKGSGEHIFKVLSDFDFKVNDFICIYLGKYKNPDRVIEKAFSIPGFHRNDIKIINGDCGDELSDLISDT